MEVAEKKDEEREEEEANPRIKVTATFKYNFDSPVYLMNDGRFMKPSFNINPILYIP